MANQYMFLTAYTNNDPSNLLKKGLKELLLEKLGK